jgi:hypothetical protein
VKGRKKQTEYMHLITVACTLAPYDSEDAISLIKQSVVMTLVSEMEVADHKDPEQYSPAER